MAKSTTQRKAGAPRGNKNRVIAPEEQRRGMNNNLSMPYEEWEAFKAAADLAEGHHLGDDEEYKEVWRRIDRIARREFIKEHRGLGGPAILV